MCVESAANIDQQYLNKSMQVARLQMLRGGVRLAFVLNRIFDPNYVPSTAQ